MYKYSDDALTELLSRDPFSAPTRETQELFENATLNEIFYQIENNELYRHFVTENIGEVSNIDLNSLPAVPAQVFKEIGQTLGTTPAESAKFVMQSSATSGIPSSVVVDDITAKRQAKSMTNVMKKVLGDTKLQMFVADASPKQAKTNAVGARYAAVTGYLKFSSSFNFLLQEDTEGTLVLSDDSEKQLATAASEGKPVIVFGFTFVLFKALLQSLIQGQKNIVLPPGSKIIHIGGWKKLEDQKVTPREFKDIAFEALGVTPENCFDIYGFTEQMGLNYPECSQGWKHVPLYSQLRVLDAKNLESAKPGVSGLLEFTSPIPHSYPGNRVITDDVGYLNPQKECGCGWSGQSFKITGRRKRAEIRGCGDILGESLAVQVEINSSTSSATDVVVEFPPNINASSDLQKLEELAADLSASRDLSELSTSEIISAISELRATWMDQVQNGKLSHLRNHGLGFLIDWSAPENLRNILSRSVRGGLKSLDGFSQIDQESNEYIHAQPRGLVSQWVSGNVPMLGMFAIIQAWLTKNPSLVRISSSGQDMLSVLLKPLLEVSESSSAARILANNTVIVSFHRDNDLANKVMSRFAATRIAWGGREAINSISNLSKSPETVDLMFGPKTSFVVLDESMISSPIKLKKIARRLASDAFVFNQIACASPHTLFIRTADKKLLETFCIDLEKQMELSVDKFPALELDESLAAQIRLSRSLAQFRGFAKGPSNLNFSIISSDSEGLPLPTFGRTLVVKAVSSLDEIYPLIHSEVQSVALSLPNHLRWDFALKAASLGVQRFPDIGRMTNFDVPWDGKFMADSFVRYVPLGGPF